MYELNHFTQKGSTKCCATAASTGTECLPWFFQLKKGGLWILGEQCSFKNRK